MTCHIHLTFFLKPRSLQYLLVLFSRVERNIFRNLLPRRLLTALIFSPTLFSSYFFPFSAVHPPPPPPPTHPDNGHLCLFAFAEHFGHDTALFVSGDPGAHGVVYHSLLHHSRLHVLATRIHPVPLFASWTSSLPSFESDMPQNFIPSSFIFLMCILFRGDLTRFRGFKYHTHTSDFRLEFCVWLALSPLQANVTPFPHCVPSPEPSALSL